MHWHETEFDIILEGMGNLDGLRCNLDASNLMSQQTPSANGKTRLLLVDDDESARITLAMAIKKRGYAVSVAEDADAALRLLSLQQFSWVVSDIRMPGMTGIELASRISLQFPGVRCILISAFAMAEELTELGVVACLEKPVDSVRLFELLHANGDGANDCGPSLS